MRSDRRLRRLFVGLLVVLTILGVVASTVAVWARSTVFDSDRWAQLAGRVIRDPEVVDALSFRVSTGIVEGLDVEQRIESALAAVEPLPPQAALVAGPVTEAIRGRLDDRIGDLLRDPRVQRLWVRANRAAHDAIVRLLRGESRPGITVGAGTVTLNLLPLINRALAATHDILSDLLGRPIVLPTAEEIAATGAPDRAREVLEDRLGVSLPDNFGEIEVLRSDRLAVAQDAAGLLDRFVLLLVVVTLVLLVASVALSVARRRTLIHLALGVLVGALIAKLVIRALEAEIVDLAAGQFRGAVLRVVADVFGGLVSLTTVLVLVGILIGIAAYLAGRPPWLGRLGDRIRTAATGAAASRARDWIALRTDALRFAGVLAAVTALFLVDLSWVTLIAVATVLAIYQVGLASVARTRSAVGTPSGPGAAGSPPADGSTNRANGRPRGPMLEPPGHERPDRAEGRERWRRERKNGPWPGWRDPGGCS